MKYYLILISIIVLTTVTTPFSLSVTGVRLEAMYSHSKLNTIVLGDAIRDTEDINAANEKINMNVGNVMQTEEMDTKVGNTKGADDVKAANIDVNMQGGKTREFENIEKEVAQKSDTKEIVMTVTKNIDIINFCFSKSHEEQLKKFFFNNEGFMTFGLCIKTNINM
jgi:hypothetical protein